MAKGTVKKLLAFLVVAVMLLSLLAGCSGNKANETTMEAKETAAANDTKSETTASKEPVKLVVWNTTFKTSDDTGKFSKDELIYNKSIKEFQEQNKNIKIESVDQAYDNIPNLFKAAGLAKNGPDIAILWAGSFTNDYKEFILPLDKYFKEDELSKFQKLTQCRTDFKDDGQLIGIPTESTSINIFYNKELFIKAGLDENIIPATWEEYIEVCKKLKVKGITPLIVGDKEGWHSTWAMCEFLSDLYGSSDIFKFKDGEAKPTDEKFVNAMKKWTEFFTLGYTNTDYSSMPSQDSMTKFLNGEAAMRLGGSWDTADVLQGLGDKAGTFMIPSFAKDAPYPDYLCSQFSNNFIVTNYSKNPEAAVQFIKYMTSSDFQAKRYAQDGQLPSRIDVDISTDKTNPLAVTSFSWIKQNKNVIGFDSVMPADPCQEFYRLAPAVIARKMTVEEMAKHLQEKLNASLKK